MQVSHSPITQPMSPAAARHHHAEDESCPLCEQPIPHDQAEEIKERIETRDRERSAEIEGKLQDRFSREKAEALEQARQETAALLEREREEAATRLIAAREEERQAAEAASAEKLAQAAQASEQTQVTLRGQIEEAQNAKAAADQVGHALREQMEELRRNSEAAVEMVRADAAATVAEIRAGARQVAEAEVKEELAALERSRQESEAALQARIEQAEAAKATAEQQVQSLNAAHEVQLAQRLQEQRDALEQAKTDAVNAEKSAAYEEKMKWSGKVEDLQRALDKKTAEELGEGAEIDLFEALKAEFDGEKIERINKGQPGADILHTVINNGKECGKIIYDSKNHNAWRNEFVTKLASDQMAAKAEHAILSTRKFPAGARQLEIQSNVILASPARVVAIVQIVRQHIVQTHALRLSNEARDKKTAELYAFMISERCTNILGRIQTHTDSLLDLQAKEIKAHETTWKEQGKLIRSVQKVRAELCNEIETIIGTAEAQTSSFS